MEKATLAGGCFWCTEAIFKRLKGVSNVVSGYAGGDLDNPSYYKVVEGTTGHAESIQLEYDPEIISFENILEVFFTLVDPTTLNQQGNDVGTQYRSVIFYHNEEQEKTARKVIEQLTRESHVEKPIVTEVTPFTNFYNAEEYHQNYFEKNPTALYCQVVIGPKVKKLLEKFGDKVSTSP